MSAPSLASPPDPQPTSRPRRLALALVLILGGLLAYLPFSFAASISPAQRLPIWGALTLALLALALLARRRPRLAAYAPVLWAFFAAAAVNLVDWQINDQLAALLHVAPRSAAGFALGLLESMLIIVTGIIVLIRLDHGDLGSLLIKRGKVRLWLPLGLLGFTFFAVTVIPAAMNLFGGRNVTWERIWPWTPWILLFVFSNAIREEVWFRGLLLPRFRTLLGADAAVYATSVVFGLAHVGVNYTPVLLLFLGITIGLGLIFATLADKSDSLWGSVLIHAGADIPVIVGILSTL